MSYQGYQGVFNLPPVNQPLEITNPELAQVKRRVTTLEAIVSDMQLVVTGLQIKCENDESRSLTSENFFQDFY